MTLSEIQRALNIGTAKAMRVQAIMSDVERTCATCRHADAEMAPSAETRFCTLNVSWFSGKLMHRDEGCTKWEARDDTEEEDQP